VSSDAKKGLLLSAAEFSFERGGSSLFFHARYLVGVIPISRGV
jgi:hypothetical protein